MCCQLGFLFLVSTCFSTLTVSPSKVNGLDDSGLEWSKVDITKSKFALLKAIKIRHPDLPEACDIWLHPPAALDMKVTVTLEDEDEILGFRVQEAQSFRGGPTKHVLFSLRTSHFVLLSILNCKKSVAFVFQMIWMISHVRTLWASSFQKTRKKAVPFNQH